MYYEGRLLAKVSELYTSSWLYLLSKDLTLPINHVLSLYSRVGQKMLKPNSDYFECVVLLCGHHCLELFIY